ncbi:hypothetical protein A8B79_12830 [Balneola sp. EhC07]|nr:hypothetical protein A8B79_12830 [Balneola sp. EhC07]
MPIFLLIGCSTNTELPPENDMIIPLAEGNYWVYETNLSRNDTVVFENRLDTLSLAQEFIFNDKKSWKFGHTYDWSPFGLTLFDWYKHISIDSLGVYFTCTTDRANQCIEREEFIFPASVEDTTSFIWYDGDSILGFRNITIDMNLDYSTSNRVYKVETLLNESKTFFHIVSGIGIVYWEEEFDNSKRTFSLISKKR